MGGFNAAHFFQQRRSPLVKISKPSFVFHGAIFEWLSSFLEILYVRSLPPIHHRQALMFFPPLHRRLFQRAVGRWMAHGGQYLRLMSDGPVGEALWFDDVLQDAPWTDLANPLVWNALCEGIGKSLERTPYAWPASSVLEAKPLGFAGVSFPVAPQPPCLRRWNLVLALPSSGHERLILQEKTLLF